MLLAAAVTVAALGCGTGDDGAATDLDRPNIVFLVLDDLDATVTPVWEAMPRSRALIADRGVTFTQAIATNPVCCPARATLLTGMLPHNTNVYDSVTGLEAFATDGSRRTIGVRLGEAGYATAFIGKYLNGYEKDPSYVPPGWDKWFALAGKTITTGYDYQVNHDGVIESYGRAPEDYQTDVLAEAATAFVDEQTGDDAPLMLTLFPTAPHATIPPAPRHADHAFVDAPLPRRANFDELDVSDKPLWLREGYSSRMTEAEISGQESHFRRGLGSLLAVDDMVGAVADRLEAADELDDTVFVLTSDNGFSYGAHRLLSKLVPYEESIRVPLAMAGPDIARGTDDGLVGHPDITATLYDIAGVDLPADVDGRSLRRHLGGDRPAGRDDLLIEFNGVYNALVNFRTMEHVRVEVADGDFYSVLSPSFRAVRTPRWLYVQWYEGDEHEEELYDLDADPFQLENLIATPAGAEEHGTTTAGLRQRMVELQQCSGTSCR